MIKTKPTKVYNIPVIWQSWGIIEIAANSLESAKKKVFSPGCRLPEISDYIEDSLEIDEEGIENYNYNNKA